jgi:hypothetical protein
MEGGGTAHEEGGCRRLNLSLLKITNRRSRRSASIHSTRATTDTPHAAQFTESREKIATYIQRCGWDESYLVAETIRSGAAQKIGLPPRQVDPNDPDRADLEAMRIEDVKNVAKR